MCSSQNLHLCDHGEAFLRRVVAKPALHLSASRQTTQLPCKNFRIPTGGGLLFRSKSGSGLLPTRISVRVDAGGGGTDAPPFSVEHGGMVVNFAVQRHAFASVERLEAAQARASGS